MEAKTEVVELLTEQESRFDPMLAKGREQVRQRLLEDEIRSPRTDRSYGSVDRVISRIGSRQTVVSVSRLLLLRSPKATGYRANILTKCRRIISFRDRDGQVLHRWR
jgi:hypothetical protein